MAVNPYERTYSGLHYDLMSTTYGPLITLNSKPSMVMVWGLGVRAWNLAICLRMADGGHHKAPYPSALLGFQAKSLGIGVLVSRFTARRFQQLSTWGHDKHGCSAGFRDAYERNSKLLIFPLIIPIKLPYITPFRV